MVGFERVTQRLVEFEAIVIPTPEPLAFEVTLRFEVRNDHLGGALGNTDRRGDIAKA